MCGVYDFTPFVRLQVMRLYFYLTKKNAFTAIIDSHGKNNAEAIKIKFKLFLWFIKHLEMKHLTTAVKVKAVLISR